MYYLYVLFSRIYSILYSSDKKNIPLISLQKLKLDTEGTNYKILYTFDKTEQEKISYKLNSEDSYPDSMSISAKAFDKC